MSGNSGLPARRFDRTRAIRAMHLGAALLLACLIAGCAPKMMPTPIGYRSGGADPFAAMGDDARTSTIDVLYATDRARSGSTRTVYTSQRGLSLRLGVASVQIGKPGTSWETLEAMALRGDRPEMEVTGLEEFGKLWTTIPFSDPDFVRANASMSEQDDVRAATRVFI